MIKVNFGPPVARYRSVTSANGVPQDSSISPIAFNHYIDLLISIIKNLCPRVELILPYANRLMIVGVFNFKKLEIIMRAFSLYINPKTCATLNWRTPDLPCRPTFRYLNTRIMAKGKTIGVSAIEKRIMKVATNVSNFERHYYPLKTLRLALSIAGSIRYFYEKRMPKLNKIGAAVKKALHWPRGLKKETTFGAVLSILKEGYARSTKVDEANSAEEFARIVSDICRLDGLIKEDGTRIKVIWNIWYRNKDLIKKI